jgi:plasmid stability protein
VASITIRNIEDDLKRALRVRAARNGCSMEEQARRLLIEGIAQDDSLDRRRPLSAVVAEIMQEAGGGVELEPYPDRPIDFARLDRRSNFDETGN